MTAHRAPKAMHQRRRAMFHADYRGDKGGHHIDPQRYLHYVLERIADHPINRIEELLPWNVVD